MHEAVIGGNSEIVAFLVKRGANILSRDTNGSMPIHLACAANNVSAVRFLLGAKTSKKSLLAKDGKGNTARQLCPSKFLRTIIEGNFFLKCLVLIFVFILNL